MICYARQDGLYTSQCKSIRDVNTEMMCRMSGNQTAVQVDIRKDMTSTSN
jgi:hypothetical protein